MGENLLIKIKNLISNAKILKSDKIAIFLTPLELEYLYTVVKDKCEGNN